MKFDVRNRFGEVQFIAEIECSEDTASPIKLGLAVKWAVRADANLTGAYLTGANLTGANLTGANLAGAYLTGANLTGANLAGANLAGANLTGANLAGAYLTDANPAGANLAGANLTGANLAGANLAGANLADANLADANGSYLAIAKTRILPDGELIVWKKCRDDVLVKLRIPPDAKRSHAFGRKCRAEFADCLEIIGADRGVSQHDEKTVYKAGERVVCDAWDADWTKECSGGIHFFITRAEAEAW
jgi:hypothetical protein